ncbi:NADH-quinone oxidoreductase subunit C [Nakamurella endophytica]|uniref:NADH-quinone oxidoreductase subunit C n=1 Tax=Nakamurella endophytica TaxID=1748367 RepID=UPI0035713624
MSSSADRPASTQTGTNDGPGSAEHQGAGSAAPAAGQALATPTPSDGAGGPPDFVTGVERTGMFGVHGAGDTSGYGLLVREPSTPVPAERPYGGWFDEVADTLFAAMAERGVPAAAVERVTVAHSEITFYLAREHLSALLWIVRDDPGLRFELAASISGVDYGPGVPRRLHVVYELLSMTYRRRIRLEVAVDVDDPHVPSAVPTYPTADWQERETWDMFGVVFDGHPALTRILMPDDWEGHPQRKDYPLGGIPVEYKGAEIQAPDQRRSYS